MRYSWVAYKIIGIVWNANETSIGTAVYGTVCSVVGEDGSRKGPSYPIGKLGMENPRNGSWSR